jgi:nucleoside-diphosphate-sugar epimerase
VSRALCSQGAQVHLIVRNQTVARKIFATYGIDGHIFELDLQVPEDVKQLLQNIRPAIVFNLAGYGVDRVERDEKVAYQINVGLVQALCEAVVDRYEPTWLGQDIVHVGSALEYGSIGGNLPEDASPEPTTLYGRTKLAGTDLLTKYCNTYGVKGLTARLFTVYGPGEHRGRLLPSLLETARTRRGLQLTSGEQRRDFTYVEDVAHGLLRLGLTQAPLGEVVNLATGRLTSVRSFVETAARVLRIPDDNLQFGAIPLRTDEIEHSEVALDRLRRLIAWMPLTPIVEGIRKTLDFEQMHGKD